MPSLFSRLRLMSIRLAYVGYCTATKVRQWPSVALDSRPRFLSDETSRPAAGGLYAIVVKYARFGLTSDFMALLDALERAGVNAIVVCNGRLSPGEHDRLLERAHRVLVRRNVGRDMGAYRAASLHLHAQGLRPQRVLYFNDSIFYLKGERLDALVRDLCGGAFDVTGAFENHEKAHHLGSYALSVGGRVFGHRHVQQFWQRYRPYDLRPHAILHGEVGLSACLKRCGFTIDVVYGAEKLVRRLHALDLRTLMSMINVMRPAFRLQPLDHLVAQSMSALRLIEPLSVSEPVVAVRAPAVDDAAAAAPDAAARPALEPSAAPTLGNYRAARKAQLAQQCKAADEARRAQSLQAAQAAAVTLVADNRLTVEMAESLARQALIDRLMLEVTQGSQVHLGFGLFRTLMDCPIVKRDLIARDIYLEHDCEMLMSDVDADTRAMVVRALINRGRPMFVQGRRRFLLDHGLV